MTITLRCTHCNQSLAIAPRKRGSRLTCPACGGTLTVPALEPGPTTGSAPKPQRTHQRGSGRAQEQAPADLAPAADGSSVPGPLPTVPPAAAGPPEASSRHPKVVTLASEPVTTSVAPSPLPPEAEPWFYGFLERYAKVGMWLAIAALALATPLLIGVLWMKEGGHRAAVGGATVLLLVLAAVVLFGILFGTALLLLLVDTGRNLRAIRHGSERSVGRPPQNSSERRGT